MPQDIYECILRRLEAVHFGSSSTNCGACYVTDLYNLALTSRSWAKTVRKRLYTKLLVTADTHFTSKKTRSGNADKLRLLLRTLRQNPSIARTVKEVQVSDWLQVYEFANDWERNDIIESISAIVMACTNLERLIGFHTVYNHEMDSLTQALSTRTRLKERLWIIRDDQSVIRRNSTRRDDDDYSRPDYSNSFLQRHVNWASLETLVLFGHDGSTGMDYRSFVGTFRKLQCLKRLCIATFPASEFNDRTLQAIPELHALRLQSLPGVTDKGLTKFLGSEAAASLRGLSLIDLEITSLPVLAKMFNNLTRLRKFTLSQNSSPSLPPGAVLPHPFLASETLEYLHWDILRPGQATADLANCIDSGTFPALRQIRAPTDYSGDLQEQCRPVAQVVHDSDTLMINLLNAPVSESHYMRTLREARLAAQKRWEEAREKPFMKIIIEEEGKIEHVYTMRDYMGKIGSKIDYSLEPDVEGSNDAIIGLADLISPKRDDGMEKMCTGPVNDKEVEGRKVWSHRPRRKGRCLEIKQLF